MKRAWITGAVLIAAAGRAYSGDISWEKDYAKAVQTGKETCRPIVLLFGVGSNGRSC